MWTKWNNLKPCRSWRNKNFWIRITLTTHISSVATNTFDIIFLEKLINCHDSEILKRWNEMILSPLGGVKLLRLLVHVLAAPLVLLDHAVQHSAGSPTMEYIVWQLGHSGIKRTCWILLLMCTIQHPASSPTINS